MWKLTFVELMPMAGISPHQLLVQKCPLLKHSNRTFLPHSNCFFHTFYTTVRNPSGRGPQGKGEQALRRPQPRATPIRERRPPDNTRQSARHIRVPQPGHSHMGDTKKECPRRESDWKRCIRSSRQGNSYRPPRQAGEDSCCCQDAERFVTPLFVSR